MQRATVSTSTNESKKRGQADDVVASASKRPRRSEFDAFALEADEEVMDDEEGGVPLGVDFDDSGIFLVDDEDDEYVEDDEDEDEDEDDVEDDVQDDFQGKVQDEVQDEVEDGNDGGVVITKAARKTKAWYLDHPEWHHLALSEPKQPQRRVRLDKHDPSSFRCIKVGTAGQYDWKGNRDLLREIQDDHMPALRNFHSGMLGVIRGRQEQLDSNAAIGASKAKILRNDTAEDILNRIMGGPGPGRHGDFASNTAAALGRVTFQLSDLDDMATFTEADLRNWLVYLAVVVQADGTFEKYVGVSVNAEGSGHRVLGDYEKALQTAALGKFPNRLRESFLLRRALQPGAEMHLRPLMKYIIPDDDEEAREAYQFVHFVEGVMSDYEQTLELNGHVQKDNHGKVINDPHLEFLSTKVAPENRAKNWVGLNKVSPIYQGYERLVNPAMLLIRAKLAEAGYTDCPICGKDLRRSERSLNPLVEKVPWMTEPVICNPCCAFMKNNNSTHLKRIVAECHSVDDLVQFRANRLGHWRSKQSRNAKAEKFAEAGPDCSLCDRTMEMPLPNEFKSAALKRLRAVDRVSLLFERCDSLVPTFKFLEDTPGMCRRCFTLLYHIRHEPHQHKKIRVQLNACKTIADASEVLLAHERERQTKKEVSAAECPRNCELCDKVVMLPGESRTDANRRLRKDGISNGVGRPNQKMLDGIPCLHDVQTMCSACTKRINECLAPFRKKASESEKKRLTARKEWLSTATLEEVRAFRKK